MEEYYSNTAPYAAKWLHPIPFRACMNPSTLAVKVFYRLSLFGI